MAPVVLQYKRFIMRKIDKFKHKWIDFKYDHVVLLEGLNIAKSTFLSIFAAAFYAFAFYCFVTPASVDHSTVNGSSIITGGVGGITQVIALILELSGLNVNAYTIQSIGYFVLNIPILIFAFFKIGKRFAIITLINVALSSAFIQLFKLAPIMSEIANAIKDEHLARVLFAGVCVGLSSASAYLGEVSCGGIDVFSYYFSMRKSTSIGKYSVFLNSFIISFYTILTIVYNKGEHVDVAILAFMYSVIYLLVNMLVVDVINVKNKKVQVQIITNRDDMRSILIANFPHSNTVVKAKGGYSHTEKQIIYMIISSNETKKVISLARRIDPKSFIAVTSLIQTYGNFFIKPVE